MEESERCIQSCQVQGKAVNNQGETLSPWIGQLWLRLESNIVLSSYPPTWDLDVLCAHSADVDYEKEKVFPPIFTTYTLLNDFSHFNLPFAKTVLLHSVFS